MPSPAGSPGTSLEEITITRRLGGLCLVLIAVVLSANPGSAGVLDASWTAPVTNTDGSQLSDLGSYRLYYAPSPGSPCPGSTFVQVPSLTTTPNGETISARITGLTPGTSYTAAVTAVDINGSESVCSGTASATAGSSFSVTPTLSLGFGSVNIGGVGDQVFVVQNTRGGTVNGTVTVAAPFSVVDGSSFALVGNGATKNVIVRFAPTSGVLSTTNVRFSADGDVVNRTVTGTGVGSAPTPTFALTVSKAGAGGGTVTSSPAGISCGATCSGSFTSGTIVTLTAAPVAGSPFTGWSGACTGTGTCTVTMNAARAVTASFGVQSFALTANKSGAGTGTVTSVPAGISCGGACSASFTSGTTVTLTAAPTNGSTFTGWSGSACTGTGTCTVTMTAARSVTAAFAAAQTLSLAVNPSPGVTGTPVTVTVTNWTGAGWIAIAPSGSPDSGYGPWVYVSSLPLVGNTRTWSVTPPGAGSYQVRLYSEGYTRAATGPTFTVADPVATLTVNPSPGVTGTPVTVTVTNWTGVGWITIAPSGSPDSGYGPWVSVSSLPLVGNTRTWSVTPPGAGSYEVRLYSEGYTRAATGPTFNAF
jgi:List-Bact-rpt repeat protein/fibronectin type III domain protein